jgi:hypothetical protein
MIRDLFTLTPASELAEAFGCLGIVWVVACLALFL